MISSARSLVHGVTPPVVATYARRWLKRDPITFRLGFENWSDASSAATGYDQEAIAKQVLEATLAVASGRAAFERDGVLFDHIEYSWPLTAGLLLAVGSGSPGHVMDFGGALGGTYLGHRALLPSSVTWSVVEQPSFVRLAEAHVAVPGLSFFTSVRECVAARAPSIALLSSVLQYLPNPFEMLASICAEPSIEWVLIDRTSCVDRGSSLPAVQTVRPPIYDASYPVWFLEEQRVNDVASSAFDLVASFDSFERWTVGRRVFQDRGWIFRRRRAIHSNVETSHTNTV